jgi:hypothetical protein
MLTQLLFSLIQGLPSVIRICAGTPELVTSIGELNLKIDLGGGCLTNSK